MIDTTIQVRTEHFDGPLALLLHLIDQEEMDIKNWTASYHGSVFKLYYSNA